jgi:hypothetical protein
MNEMFAGAADVKHRRDKKYNQTENQKIKRNPSGNRRLPEPTVRFKMFYGFHMVFPYNQV